MSKNDIPAFPSGTYTDGHKEDGTPVLLPVNDGMTLRDWFAGQALASHILRGLQCAENEVVARQAYGLADAMLAQRDAPEGDE
jgi:hypothetical protein